MNVIFTIRMYFYLFYLFVYLNIKGEQNRIDNFIK